MRFLEEETAEQAGNLADDAARFEGSDLLRASVVEVAAVAERATRNDNDKEVTGLVTGA